ncbi:hypothetical protein ACWD25_37185 [Streptomyces sp. NPDC002920]
MNCARYSLEQKIYHLLQWAAGWHSESAGESMWSYSQRLGGSHALLNGWMKNAKVMSSLTAKESNYLNVALTRSTRARYRRMPVGRQDPVALVIGRE